jgi:hypothetical protein
MNPKTAIKAIQNIDEEALGIMKRKSADYANPEKADVLTNFKRVSAAAKALNLNVTTPEGYSLFMVLLKIDRLNNLIHSDKEPVNESITDSYIDGLNYLKLSLLCWQDREPDLPF